jgi:predicted transcriptional regulator
MAITGKILAQGTLPAALGTLYTAPTTTTYVKFFSLYNGANSTETVLINVSGSTSTVVGRVVLARLEHALVIAKDETLVQKIEGVSSHASAVQYTIIGGDE